MSQQQFRCASYCSALKYPALNASATHPFRFLTSLILVASIFVLIAHARSSSGVLGREAEIPDSEGGALHVEFVWSLPCSKRRSMGVSDLSATE